jgi:hypothetical protein
VWGGATFDLTLGDGTAPNACFYINIHDIIGNAFSADANNENIGLRNTIWTTYTNNSIKRVTVGNVAPGQLVDALGYLGIKERDRSVAMGEWTTPAFDAGDFTSDSGTWVVASGDVTTYEYTLIGKTMIVNFSIATSTTTGTPNNLRIKIPGGFTSNKQVVVPYLRNNNGGAYGTGACFVNPGGGTNIFLYFDYIGGSNWAAGTDNTNVQGSITFEVA